MSLNCKEIDLILSELELAGSLVREIYQPDYHTLILELYQRGRTRFVQIRLSNPHCRLHEIEVKKRNKPNLPRFIPFLRNHIRGGKILEAFQVRSERIIKIVTIKGGLPVWLWVRLWAAQANIIVTGPDGVILDAYYRRPKRGEVSGGRFDPESQLAARPGKQKEYAVRVLNGPGTFNQKIARYYEELEGQNQRQILLSGVLKRYETKENNLLVRLEKFNAGHPDREGPEQLKQIGDLIKANLSQIQKGQKWLKADNFYKNNMPVEIELDPRIGPYQNAEKYYKKYQSTKERLERTARETVQIEQELDLVRQRIKQLKDPLTGLDQIKDLAPRKKTAIRTQVGQEVPGQSFTSGDFEIIVGKKAKDNDILLRKHMKGNDYWFHTRDYPGAYVFVKSRRNQSLPLETMLDAGNLAVFFSKAKQSGQGDVYYTQVKYLRRVKNGKTGLVIPTSEKNLHIRLEQNRIARLRGTRP